MISPDDQTALQWGLVIAMVFYSIVGPERILAAWEWVKGGFDG